MINLTLNTDVGKLNAIFLCGYVDNRVVWTGYIEEYPGVVIQSDSIEEGMNKLPKILDDMLILQIKSIMEGC